MIEDDLAAHQLVVRALEGWDAHGVDAVRVAWALATLIEGFVGPRTTEENAVHRPPPALPDAALLAFAEPDGFSLKAAQETWTAITGFAHEDGSPVAGPAAVDELRHVALTYESTGLLMLVSWCRLLRDQAAGTQAGRDLDELLALLRLEL